MNRELPDVEAGFQRGTGTRDQIVNIHWIMEKAREFQKNIYSGSKLGKEYVKAVYCHPACLTHVQSTSCEMPGWMNHKLESRLLEEISIISDMQMIPPLWQKVKRN